MNLHPSVQALVDAAYKQGLQDRPQAPEDVKVNYLNANGDPEFASIHLTLDHMTGSGHQKVVLDMGTAEDTLYELFDYYGERQRIMALPSTLNQIVEARLNPERGIFLYVVPSELATDRFGGLIVQAVMSTVAWVELIKHPDYGNGSEWRTINKLVDAFKVILEEQRARLGELPALTFLSLTTMVKAKSEPSKRTSRRVNNPPAPPRKDDVIRRAAK